MCPAIKWPTCPPPSGDPPELLVRPAPLPARRPRSPASLTAKDGFVYRRGRWFDFCTYSGLEIWSIAPRTAPARFLIVQTKPPTHVTMSLELLTKECYPPVGILISNLLGLLW